MLFVLTDYVVKIDRALHRVKCCCIRVTFMFLSNHSFWGKMKSLDIFTLGLFRDSSVSAGRHSCSHAVKKQKCVVWLQAAISPADVTKKPKNYNPSLCVCVMHDESNSQYHSSIFFCFRLGSRVTGVHPSNSGPEAGYAS